MPAPAPSGGARRLEALRRGGVVTDLLFLFECLTERPVRLAPIARSLGVTVQAASASFRRLRSRGLAELRGGRYTATLRGVAWLHRAFQDLRDDLGRRLERLHVIRSTRAVALEPIAQGERVRLEMRAGTLAARTGRGGPSVGTALAAARAGALVEVGNLEGILPIHPGRVRLITVDGVVPPRPALLRRLRRELAGGRAGLLGAPGLEAQHLLAQISDRPFAKFGVAAVCLEASQRGVDSTVLLLDEELPRFLEQLGERGLPPVQVAPLRERAERRRS